MIACEKLFKLLHNLLAATTSSNDASVIANDNEKNRIAVVYVEILMLDQLHLDSGGSSNIGIGGSGDEATAGRSEDMVSVS